MGVSPRTGVSVVVFTTKLITIDTVCDDITVFLVYFSFTSSPCVLTSLLYHGNGSSRDMLRVFGVREACKLF